jgi:inosose dehydratase
MNITIGSAPDNWGVWFPSDPLQTPWTRFLDELVEAGYTWTELGPYGYMPPDLPLLQSELGWRGVRVTGTFAQAPLSDPAAWPSLERQVLGAGELLAALGAKFQVLIDSPYTDERTGQPLRPSRLADDAWARLIATTQRVAELARANFGLQLVFHPHAETNVEYEDQIERFLADTDPAAVALCFDTGHHAYRGGDPVAFMRRHHARIPYLHLKSVDGQVQRRVAAEHIPFGAAVGMDMFCELAQGVVDFAAFRDVLRDVNYAGWAIVEQDMYPAPFDKPLPIAKRNRAYLRELGLG